MKNICCLFIILLSATLASAMQPPESSINCHCFQNRSFDPQNKFAADTYLLTTSFNSFIAANFHISKSQIVMMKMKASVAPDDLLIGLFVARSVDVDLKSLLAILDNGGSWRQILEASKLQETEMDHRVQGAMCIVADDKSAMVEIVTDQLLKEFFGVTDDTLADIRKESTNGRELVLVYLLEKFGKREESAANIMAMHTQKKMSWGEIAKFFGFTPKGTGNILLESS